MNTAKTVYTYRELTRRSTEQLIRIYNRIFNVNAWDFWFNPCEHRGMMIVELMTEFEGQKAIELWKAQGSPIVNRSKPVEIVLSHQGMAVIWRAEEQPAMYGKQTAMSQAVMNLIRALREDGATYAEIVSITKISKTNVFRVLKGEFAQETTKWNTTEKHIKTTANSKVMRKESVQSRQSQFVENSHRPQNQFWMQFGL